MSILSISFFLLILISFIFYYSIPKKYQWIVLLFASIIFYIYSGITNFIFIFITAITTFYSAKLLNNKNKEFLILKKSGDYDKEQLKEIKLKFRTKKRVLLFSTLILNFGILAALKYWNTIIKSLDLVLNSNISFLLLNHGKGLLLPLGISFYTFQSIGYLLDVYNSKIDSEKNFAKFYLFVSFFPQLIQGPINRYDSLGKQFAEEHSFNYDNVKEGLLQFLYGAVKKYAIADLLYNYISKIFDTSYNNLPGSIVVFGILMYSIYQYADFSGGIDMVIGISKLFGIRMQPNFKQPYFSVSLADFWRRWHISLGLWMKDYVFYPFVLTEYMQKFTKKCTKLGKHFARAIPAGIANILVFLIVGIWHGPEMHYVLWGLYNGLVIALSDLLKPVFTNINDKLKIETKSLGFKIFQIIRTFIIVNIGWYFDRIYDVKKSFILLGNTFTKFHIKEFNSVYKILFDGIKYQKSRYGVAIIATIIVFVTSIITEKNGDIYGWYKKQELPVRWSIIYILLFTFLISLSFPNGNVGFMYANY